MDNKTIDKTKGPAPVNGFKPGISGNPAGRPKGSVGPKKKIKGFLTEILKKKEVQTAIYDALLEYMLNEPLDAAREFDLLEFPKNGSSLNLEIDGDVIRPISVNIMPTAANPAPSSVKIDSNDNKD